MLTLQRYRAGVGFRNSTFGAEYKCTDLERYGVKMDEIAEHVAACLRPVIYTPLTSGGVNLLWHSRCCAI
jgi:hypothetical protein